MQSKQNPNKESKISIVFDDMISDMLSNKKLQLKNSVVIHTLFYNENWKQKRASTNCS